MLSRQFFTRSLAGLFVIAVFLVGIKYHSSLGRLHIWYIDMQLLQQQSWWHGVGLNGFNVAYNHAQAAWFSQASLYTQRAMLANDGYFAFNEFMQLAIEYGWWAGVALLLAFAAFIYQQYLLVRHRVPIVSVAFIATQLLWPIAIGCWVAYPLHTWYGPAIAIGLSACVIASFIIRHRAIRGGILLAILLGTATFLLVANHNRQAEKKLLGTARELWQIGHKTAAIEQLSAYCRTHPLAIPHHETLAAWYWLSGKEKEAIQTLETHHQQHCNQRLHQQLGQWYALQHNNTMASYHLHTSLYITPHLLTSRACLADFYWRIGDIDSATYWTKDVVQYPPKIQNTKATHLKQLATHWLENPTSTTPIFQIISN
ncbi:hypothetical protein [Phnomibacter sp. MR]|uniref:hypothetical protein n=1 Tax=Phnomibacter sp. MR TaxID=3042318 RepID=UPI003A803ACD